VACDLSSYRGPPTTPAGESNALTGDPEASYYLCALPFLVASLRSVFNSPDMHVSVIQLAPWARYVQGKRRLSRLSGCLYGLLLLPCAHAHGPAVALRRSTSPSLRCESLNSALVARAGRHHSGDRC